MSMSGGAWEIRLSVSSKLPSDQVDLIFGVQLHALEGLQPQPIGSGIGQFIQNSVLKFGTTGAKGTHSVDEAG